MSGQTAEGHVGMAIRGQVALLASYLLEWSCTQRRQIKCCKDAPPEALGTLRPVRHQQYASKKPHATKERGERAERFCRQVHPPVMTEQRAERSGQRPKGMTRMILRHRAPFARSAQGLVQGWALVHSASNERSTFGCGA